MSSERQRRVGGGRARRGVPSAVQGVAIGVEESGAPTREDVVDAALEVGRYGQPPLAPVVTGVSQ